MNRKTIKLITIILILVLALGISSLSYAGGNTNDKLNDKLEVDDIIDGIKSKDKNNSLMGDGLFNLFKKGGNDAFNLVRYGITIIIVVKAMLYIGDIQRAADEPEVQRKLKRRLSFTVVAILVLINFWRIYGWLSGIDIKFT